MSTRETILTALKRQGEARADDLAQPLGLTAMAVRQHLYQLQEEGAVTSFNRSEGRGRPAKLWALTPKADVYFQDSHRDLSLDLISSIRDLMGDEALNELVEHRAGKQLDSYKNATSSEATVKGKLEALAKVRSKEGYMAEAVQTEDGDYLFLENHCPICEAAKACSGLCAKELDVFRKLFSGTASVERNEHLLAGGRRCSYKVSPKT